MRVPMSSATAKSSRHINLLKFRSRGNRGLLVEVNIIGEGVSKRRSASWITAGVVAKMEIVVLGVFENLDTNFTFG